MDSTNKKHHKRIWLIGLLLGVLLGGCQTGDDASPPSSATGRVLTGNVSKGPLSGATIRVYEIDARGQRFGQIQAQTTTNSSGNWSLTVPTGLNHLVVESSGGVYVDEADDEPEPNQRRTVTLGAADSIAALLPASASTVAMNVYTNALLRKSRQETQGANFFAVYAVNRSFLNTAFGFDITTTQPTDPIQPDASASQASRLYAMALGGAAQVVNALAIANQQVIGSYPIISALIDDLTDCRVDGRSIAGPITNVATLTRSLNNEILRFRNNHAVAYQGTPLLQIDQSQCARSGQQTDTTAPVFISFPSNFIVEAQDGQGIASAAQIVQQQLQTIQAVDDRDGGLSAVNDLPNFLLTGDTSVNYTATDLAGNSRTVTLIISVAAAQPPTITAPADIVARRTGDLTLVNLGFPVVGDNVTSVANLQVTSDAPAAGFSIGIRQVIWTVTDEAGYSSQAVQRVTVGDPGVPIIDPTVPVQPGNPGYGQLPIFPDPDDIRIPPIGPDAGNTDIANPANALDLSPGINSVVIHVPVTNGPINHQFSFPGTDANNPAIVIFEPGLHSGQIQLMAPCNHVVLIANPDPSGDPLTQAQIVGTTGRALTIIGCRAVRLYQLDISDAPFGGVHLIDSQATIIRSVFNNNYADRGAALRLTRSQLTVEDSLFQHNAANFGGAIWFDLDSTLHLIDSQLDDNLAMTIDNHDDYRLLRDNTAVDPTAISGPPTQQ